MDDTRAGPPAAAPPLPCCDSTRGVGAGAAAVIRPSALLDALIAYWEMCWRQATPLDAPGEDPIGEEDRQLLILLVSGLKDEAIARQLGWSVRTMRRRMSRLLESLGAANRFQAGVIAARSGWL